MRAAVILILQFPIRIYRLILSPWVGMNCRFQPTCSEYALDALKIHGPIKGTGLAIWRILRCNPWGGSGFEPVPPRSCGHKNCSQKPHEPKNPS